MMASMVHAPTPEEIIIRCKEIQKTWSEKTRKTRLAELGPQEVKIKEITVTTTGERYYEQGED
jgi:hypothetical protein